MPNYSLVPVDDQPEFDDHSLVPVGYDPFAADGVADSRKFNWPKRSRKTRSNRQHREPVNPIPVRRLLAVFYRPCVMKTIWLTAMFIKNSPPAPRR